MALLLGAACGWLLREVAEAPAAGGAAPPVGEDRGDGSLSPEASGRKARPRDLRDESVGLSPRQWSMFVRSPSFFRVPLADCLPPSSEVPVLGDIPLVAELFSSPGLDLTRLADLLGWDDPRTSEVRDALLAFGRDLAAAETQGARIEYPEPGVIRFELSASRVAREAEFAKLGNALKVILGEKDAGRFGRIAGLGRELTDTYEITARYDGEQLRIEAPGVIERVMLKLPATPDLFGPETMEGFDRRVRHLGLEIDWSRLALEPDSAGGSR